MVSIAVPPCFPPVEGQLDHFRAAPACQRRSLPRLGMILIARGRNVKTVYATGALTGDSMGALTVMVVPLPGSERMSICPPMASMRSVIPTRPK